MSEFDEVPSSDDSSLSLAKVSSGSLKSRRVLTDFFLPLTALTVVASAFLPWLIIRLPNQQSTTFTLVNLTGGRVFTGVAASLSAIGLAFYWRFPKLGRALLAIGAALIGWLAGLGLLALGLLRGLLPGLTILGIDISRSLIGPTVGAFLAFAGVNLIGVRLFVENNSGERLKSRISLLVLISSLLLFVMHQSTWVVADLVEAKGRVTVTGDALFGALLVTISLWISVVLTVIGVIKANQLFVRIAATSLLFAAVIKLIQTIIVWSGRGLIRLIIPSRIESAVNIEILWTVHFTAGLALISIALGVFVIAVGDRPFGNINIRNFLPLLITTHTLAVIFSLLMLAPTEKKNVMSTPTTLQSLPLSPSTSTANSSQSSLAPYPSTSNPNSLTQNESLLGAVVNVTRGRPGDECSGGSGVIIGDGTYILTNEHVISTNTDDPPECQNLFIGITTSPSQPPTQVFPADILAADSVRDLALLRIIGAVPNSLPIMSPRYGILPIDSAVRVIGYPGVGGETVTLTRGQIAGYLNDEGGQYYKVDIVLNRGNSGGPMVDESGNLVGIATAVSANEVDCSGTSNCESVGGNLGLVRTIEAARDYIDRAGKGS